MFLQFDAISVLCIDKAINLSSTAQKCRSQFPKWHCKSQPYAYSFQSGIEFAPPFTPRGALPHSSNAKQVSWDARLAALSMRHNITDCPCRTFCPSYIADKNVRHPPCKETKCIKGMWSFVPLPATQDPMDQCLRAPLKYMVHISKQVQLHGGLQARS